MPNAVNAANPATWWWWLILAAVVVAVGWWWFSAQARTNAGERLEAGNRPTQDRPGDGHKKNGS